MLANRGHLVVGQRAQHERGGEVGDLVTAQPAGRSRIGHGEITLRMASRPSRMRLLTVPNGVPVRSAISTWVRPPK